MSTNPKYENLDLAFHAIQRLYGKKKFDKIQQSKILIVGIGGVGSWAAESLARSGIGKIDLVDPDEICVSNINRQIHSLFSTAGKSKGCAMRDRLFEINPAISVNHFQLFFGEETASQILSTQYDFVIDAIDSLKNKCLLITECQKRSIKVITVGGAAGKTDPSLIRVSDLAKSKEDRLLMRMRKKLRRNFNFPKGKKTIFNIPCVYSEELCLYPTSEGEVCFQKKDKGNLRLDCESGLGSASFITGAFAFHACAYIIKALGNSEEGVEKL